MFEQYYRKCCKLKLTFEQEIVQGSKSLEIIQH